MSKKEDATSSDPEVTVSQHQNAPQGKAQVNLTRFAWLSIAAAVVTIALKSGAFLLTGSVGLLSDAAESGVNLIAAIVALIALSQAAKPADSHYTYGRSKVEYFSAAIEGAMIFFAAGFIMFSAVERIIHPKPLANLGIGLVISVVASVVNGVVGLILVRAGKKFRSPTLHADGLHLFTDVVTSIGVLIGVGLVALTGWDVLDPLIALLVGVNVTITGIRLVRSSMSGLMDATLPKEQNRAIVAILAAHSSPEVTFHGLQTRRSGRDSFANVDMLVPGSWSVREGHDHAENVVAELQENVAGLRVLIHVEPIEDPRSYDDIPAGFIPISLPNDSE